jgi:hypothetical protein
VSLEIDEAPVKIAIFVMLLLAIAVLVVWNRRPVDRSAAEVANLLRLRIEGADTDGGWDYFVSCRIRDSKLEKIRASVESMEVVGSPYLMHTGSNLFALSPIGKEAYTKLLHECELLG